MGRKAAFHSLGCKVNSYETDAMRKALLDAGWEEAPFAPGADVYVINTCTVTNIADRKSRQMLHKAKEMNPAAIVAACGCYVEDAAGRLEADPAVDLLIGNAEKGKLPQILESCLKERDSERMKSRVLPRISSVRTYEELGAVSSGEHTRAFLKIQDGCNQFCSYCMIPYVRGRVRSRRPEDVLREVRALVAEGYREFVLTGIHISSYGLDFDYPGMNRQTPDAAEALTNYRLLELIRAIAAEEGVSRIRLGSLEPGIVTEDFIEGLCGEEKVCPSFHLSMQSGCDETLLRMRRKYRTKDFADKCRIIRKFYRDPAIMTDIIAGFPGETEEEFLKTLAFVREIHFSRAHIFKYSVRKGTLAAGMDGQVPEKLKKERADMLAETDRAERMAYAERFVGQEVLALFEEAFLRGGERILKGYTREYIPVELASREVPLGREVRVRVKEILPGGIASVQKVELRERSG
ncbi:MAG: tRNA (N(6)-L-threonylcarbamoyladenosine(37)-C(2))-methylthiotransferase MtaB [Lachnospiraceae bacterium]|nr:tRNA (N(6)-L-threonylcarbamoyladenosine(37)-C(2))-methylthiotransferase MtaB [Lachnospiraceae bacterium]